MATLVIGASGLVGSALIRALPAGAIGTFRARAAAGLRPLDARDSGSVRKLIQDIQPSVVYFPAAEPNVDWCELHPAEAWEANVVPALGTLVATREAGAQFVFFSTDYVFDGENGPYGEAAAVAPLSVYGQHKRAVEERVLDVGGVVIRTTTVYGQELPPGKNFVVRLVARLRSGERATIPADQFATPTSSDELARGVVAIGSGPGLWHVAGPDFMARDEFARLIAEVFDCDTALIAPVTTSSLQQAARRPMRGGLRTDKIRQSKGIAFLSTRDALRRLAKLSTGAE